MLAAAAALVLLASTEHLVQAPTVVLPAGAVDSVLHTSEWGERSIQISAAWGVLMLAVAFVGRCGGAAVAVVAELET